MASRRKRVYGIFDEDDLTAWAKGNEVKIDKNGRVRGFSIFVKRLWGNRR